MSEQSSDTLIVNGERFYLGGYRNLDWVYPLEDYLNDHPELVGPRSRRRITTGWSSESRGYEGIWEIKNNGLYLVDIIAEFKKSKGFWFWKKLYLEPVTISKLFPEAINNEIKATWFSGRLIAYTTNFVSGNVSSPDNTMLFARFENGNLISFQWYHLVERNGKIEKVPYDRTL